ncbi:MAG: hypothetical protein HY261_03515 [Chloroflexi bacterium]|nr:hypothetical protein [Chloroflexota bacterium]
MAGEARKWDVRRLAATLTLGVWVLGGLAVIAYGFWGYRSYQRSQEQTALQAQLASAERDFKLLQNASGPKAADPALRAAVVKAEALRASFLSPNDGIRVTGMVTELAERTGVALNGIQVSTGKRGKVGDMEFAMLTLNLTAHGPIAKVDEFFAALQAGVIPWLAVVDSQSDRSKPGDGQLVITADIYTLPDVTQPSAPARITVTMGASPDSTAARAGEANHVLLRFDALSRLAGSDALRSVSVHVTSPNVLTAVRLYAETSGTGNLDPATDSLIASSSAASDVVLRPAVPYRFSGGVSQRFYLAVDVATDASPGSRVDVQILARDVAFTSGVWPDDSTTAHGSLFIRQQPVALPLQAEARSGTGIVIMLAGHADPGERVAFRIVQQPAHGVLTGTPPAMTYIPLSGFSGIDQFTYVVNDGLQDSAEASATIFVSQK